MKIIGRMATIAIARRPRRHSGTPRAIVPRSHVLALSAAILAVAYTTAAAASPTAGPAPQSSGPAERTIRGLVFTPACKGCVAGGMVNVAHHLCLDAMAQHDGSNGDPVQLWRCNGRLNQVWEQKPGGDTLMNAAHNLCLDAMAQHDGSNGDPVQLWRCNGRLNQVWGPQYGEGVNYVFWVAGGASRRMMMCLDAVQQDDGSDGDKIQLWSCNGQSNQRWLA